MGSKLFLLLLLIGLCSANGDTRDERSREDKGERDYDGRLCNDGRDCEDFDIDDYNNEKNFYEPCDYVEDTECVRKFFSDFSKCTAVKYAYDKPVYRKKHTKYLPNINATFITTRDQLTKLDGKIIKFYVNKKTQNLVLAVEFKGIIIQSKKLYFIVHRVGKEPAIAADYANGTHAYTATAVIPIHDGKIQMKHARVSSYYPDASPDFYLGPKITNSKDPDVAKSVAALYADVPTAVQEYMLLEGAGFFLAYFQKYICDFGIPLSN